MPAFLRKIGFIFAFVTYVWAVIGLIALYGLNTLILFYLIPVVGQIWFGVVVTGTAKLIYFGMLISSFLLILLGTKRE